MRQIPINRFRLADLEEVLEIESAAFRQDAYAAEVFLELHQTCPDFFLVAKSHGSVVGYVASFLQGSDAEIVSIAVSPRHRRHGIGRALMMQTLAKLKAHGIRYVNLTVRSANRLAIRLYSAFGFHPVRRISQYYADGSDAIEMQKVLSVGTLAADILISSRSAV